MMRADHHQPVLTHRVIYIPCQASCDCQKSETSQRQHDHTINIFKLCARGQMYLLL